MTGFFDSGAGGLCAVKAFRRLYPWENVLYFADALHLPYGEKSPSELIQYALFAVSFLCSHGADRIVFACGTASALALPTLSGKFPCLVGVTEPAAKAAAKATRNRTVGILATRGTVNARGYEKFLQGFRTVSVAAPSLVGLAERGTPLTDSERTELKQILLPFQNAQADTLILGCTHFSLLSEEIQHALPHMTLINAGEEAVKMLPPLPREEGRRTLFATASPETYRLAFERLCAERTDAFLVPFPPSGRPYNENMKGKNLCPDTEKEESTKL